MPSFSHSFIQQICMEVKGTVVGAGDIAMKMTIVTTARGIHRLEGNTVTQPLNNASF